MPGQKYSRQREAILNYLSSTDTHPTAEAIYNNIREIYPNISLGTVYRNLNLLCEQGQILRLMCGDGSEHYDANIHQHNHLLCKECHSLIDLEMVSIDHIDTIAAANFDGKILGHVVYFYGLCSSCNANADKP